MTEKENKMMDESPNVTCDLVFETQDYSLFDEDSYQLDFTYGNRQLLCKKINSTLTALRKCLHPYIFTMDSMLTQIQLKLNGTQTVTLLAEMLLVKINTALYQEDECSVSGDAILKYIHIYIYIYTHISSTNCHIMRLLGNRSPTYK